MSAHSSALFRFKADMGCPSAVALGTVKAFRRPLASRWCYGMDIQSTTSGAIEESVVDLDVISLFRLLFIRYLRLTKEKGERAGDKKKRMKRNTRNKLESRFYLQSTLLFSLLHVD